MKVVKFTKKLDGLYNIELDNKSKILVHEDLILKYDILIKKEISEDLKFILLKENEKYVIYNKVIKYIGTKMRCVFEVENYLKKYDIDELVLNEIINKLLQQGYLNDKSYALSYVSDRINLSNDGPNKIKSHLKNNNVCDIYIEDALLSFTRELELERIEKLINKFVKSNNKGFSFFKKKITFYLIELGYNLELINEILNDLEFDDTELRKKEYNKLYSKLSKKYFGKELEYKIREKLYQKGFKDIYY